MTVSSCSELSFGRATDKLDSFDQIISSSSMIDLSATRRNIPPINFQSRNPIRRKTREIIFVWFQLLISFIDTTASSFKEIHEALNRRSWTVLGTRVDNLGTGRGRNTSQRDPFASRQERLPFNWGWEGEGGREEPIKT